MKMPVSHGARTIHTGDVQNKHFPTQEIPMSTQTPVCLGLSQDLSPGPGLRVNGGSGSNDTIYSAPNYVPYIH